MSNSNSVTIGHQDRFQRSQREIALHLIWITLCLLSTTALYFQGSAELGSVADRGKIVNMPDITKPMYTPAESQAFLSRIISTEIDYNFLNEPTRIDDLSPSFSQKAKQSIHTFLAAMDLYPLQSPSRVHMITASAPTRLDFSAPPGEPYLWSYDLTFTLLIKPLIANKVDKKYGPFSARVLVKRTEQPANGYMLIIATILFELPRYG